MKLSSEALRDALKVYLILGSPDCRRNPIDVLREAITGGITIFQFREKGDNALSGGEKESLAEEMQFYCKKAQIPFIVNDDVELAVALKADGVHIGQDDGSVEETRERIGDKILGVSVHNTIEAAAAAAGGADYFGVGPIFSTKTKKDAHPVQGIKIIEKLRTAGFFQPLVGIGGITAERTPSVIRGGADGVAVISAISHAENVLEASAILKREVEKTLAECRSRR